MIRFIASAILLLSAVTLVVSQCDPGTNVGPCLCMQDANGFTALQCTNVADGDELASVFTTIDETFLSSVDVSSSPDLVSLPDSLFGPVAVAAFSLQNTGLQGLDTTVFSSPTTDTLNYLYIKRNSQFAFSDGSLIGGLSKLGELYISFNSMTSSLEDQLADTGAYYLDFSHNSIASIAPNFFSQASNANIILLGFNGLTNTSLVTDSLNFSNIGDELYLDLGWNSLNSGVTLDALSGKVPKELILSGNGITSLDNAIFAPLLDAMFQAYNGQGYILLDNNSIECDCSIQWLINAETKNLVQQAICSDGRVVANLTPADFSSCP